MLNLFLFLCHFFAGFVRFWLVFFCFCAKIYCFLAVFSGSIVGTVAPSRKFSFLSIFGFYHEGTKGRSSQRGLWPQPKLKISSCGSGECFSPAPFFSLPGFLRRQRKADYGEKQEAESSLRNIAHNGFVCRVGVCLKFIELWIMIFLLRGEIGGGRMCVSVEKIRHRVRVFQF